ncbi:hypothetical protein [Bordetella bronchiseptica]|uniref:hypothetical protein n=1 Tax=Bordetella bronchiseptica TaxID=518 RepID=UPI00209C10C1|nr:hypothetical protein [Bordetella bronchiseptica]
MVGQQVPVHAELEAVVQLDVDQLRLDLDLAPYGGLVAADQLLDRAHLGRARAHVQRAGGAVQAVAAFLGRRAARHARRGVFQHLADGFGQLLIGVGIVADLAAELEVAAQRAAAAAAAAAAEHVAAGLDVQRGVAAQHLDGEHALLHQRHGQHVAVHRAVQVEYLQDAVEHLAGRYALQVQAGALRHVQHLRIDHQVHAQLVGQRPQQLADLGVMHVDADDLVFQRVVLRCDRV